MKKLEFRKVTVDDAKRIAEIYRPYVESTAISFEYTAPTADEIAKRIENTLKDYPYIAATCNGEVVGYAYAGRLRTRAAYDHVAETSIYIDSRFHKMGIGKELYRLLENELRCCGVTTVYACITAPADGRTDDPYANDNSIKFHEKEGYTHVGRFHSCGLKFDRWYDVVWMEKKIGELWQRHIRKFFIKGTV